METRIDRILRQLASTFTVRDIMVEPEGLTRASSRSEAQDKLGEHQEFGVIPLPTVGPITGYMHRDAEEVTKVGSSDLISDGTSLLNLPLLMSKRDFFFVLSSNMITGFVHFSDLNNSVVKLPFFALFEAVENHLWLPISKRLDETALPKVIKDPQRLETLRKRKARAQRNDIDRGWSGLLHFDEILRFANHYKIARIANDDRELLAKIRNRVAHADKVLVEAHFDTSKLVRTHEICGEILNGIVD